MAMKTESSIEERCARAGAELEERLAALVETWDEVEALHKEAFRARHDGPAFEKALRLPPSHLRAPSQLEACGRVVKQAREILATLKKHHEIMRSGGYAEHRKRERAEDAKRRREHGQFVREARAELLATNSGYSSQPLARIKAGTPEYESVCKL